jgi:hypothetical protein
MPDEAKINAENISIYDTVRLAPGGKFPERMLLSYGADSKDAQQESLFDLGESEIIEQVLADATLSQRLLGLLGIEYPDCWIVTEVLTKDLARSWHEPKPGDLDLVCGNMRNGRPGFDYITCTQVKIRKAKTLADSGDFASGSGTAQAHFTALMGFDRTLLLHCIVREPQPTPEGYAPSWNPIINTDFERAAKGCFGTIRRRLEDDRELYGYAWLGWGQAFGKAWQTCGGYAIDLVYPPRYRPALDSTEAIRSRGEMVESLRQVFSRTQPSSLPLVIRCKGKAAMRSGSSATEALSQVQER